MERDKHLEEIEEIQRLGDQPHEIQSQTIGKDGKIIALRRRIFKEIVEEELELTSWADYNNPHDWKLLTDRIMKKYAPKPDFSSKVPDES